MHRNIHVTTLSAEQAQTVTQQINQHTLETGFLARHDGEQVMIIAANPVLEDLMAGISALTRLFVGQRRESASPEANDMPHSVSHG